jgi:hypothetical protein
MRLQVLLLLFLFSVIHLHAQNVISFENFDLPQDSFLNGSDFSGGFTSGDIFLPNSYNPDFNSWANWAISTTTDTTTRGFTNQFSAITGEGFESSTYAIANAFTPVTIKVTEPLLQVDELYITNATYAYWSMTEGDGFAKKFGGIDGSDPDFFLLTIHAFINGERLANSVDFYLADYRFDDPEDDYIIDEWTRLDLSSFGQVDSLQFTLSSSDNGNYGMNTPASFCMDHISMSSLLSSLTDVGLVDQIQVYPNPTADVLQVDWEKISGQAFIFDATGRLVRQVTLQQGNNELPVHNLKNGVYYLELTDQKGRWRSTFIKQ